VRWKGVVMRSQSLEPGITGLQETPLPLRAVEAEEGVFAGDLIILLLTVEGVIEAEEAGAGIITLLLLVLTFDEDEGVG